MKLYSKREADKVILVVEANLDLKSWLIEFRQTMSSEFEACLLHEKISYDILPNIARKMRQEAYLMGWKHAKAKIIKWQCPDYFDTRLIDQ